MPVLQYSININILNATRLYNYLLYAKHLIIQTEEKSVYTKIISINNYNIKNNSNIIIQK